MFIVGLLSWWYGAGWKQRVLVAREHLLSTYDYFSLGLLLRTLFAPFRQISAGQVQGPVGVQIRAWFDRLISRAVGLVVRSMVIVIGSITLMLVVLVQFAAIVLWSLIPAIPALGVSLAMAGWLPWQY